MAFTGFPEQSHVIERLQRSLERGRLAHAYLFVGGALGTLEDIALTLAKTLNCQQPIRGASGVAIDCCDACLACRKITHGNHADVLWVRPESKTRIIKIEQITPREGSTDRTLTEFNALKPTEGNYKMGIIVAADRLTDPAANAFLKTLEEPSPRTVFLLLTTAPDRVLETIESRCQRLNFAGEAGVHLDPEAAAWLRQFADAAAAGTAGVLGRYRLLSLLIERLAAMKTAIEADLTAKSPSEQFPDAEPKQREKWEVELSAAVESEYRRQRADLLAAVHVFLRDAWVQGMAAGSPDGNAVPIQLPELAASSAAVSGRVGRERALENLRHFEQLQRSLHTNVQEALALEVGFLKLQL
ncbi:MAG TPA: hypothetical protein VI454_05160 [Verrucomicrobiae bacterium]|jgi:DNA polymerase-3 subunit delta'